MAPLNNDFIPGFDPTAFSSISQAQMYQLVSVATPEADKGLTILTTDVAGVPVVPNAAVTTKWKRYVWVRQAATSVGLYVWNETAASDATFFKWISVNIAGIGAGSIINSMIADNTITDIKIVNLDYSKLIGVPLTFAPGGVAGGILTGTYPNPSIVAGGITTAMIGAGQITHALFGAQAVEVTDLKPNGSFQDMFRTNAGATAVEFFTPPVLFTSGVVVPTANALKIPRVNAGGTDFEMITLADAGSNLLQYVAKRCTADSTAVILPYDNTIPQVGEGKEAASIIFTPKSATSVLKLRFVAWLSGNIQVAVVALFSSASANAICAVANDFDGGANGRPESVTLEYILASPGTAPVTFSIRYGPGSAGTCYLLRDNVDTMLGAAAVGTFSIEEVVGSVS